MDEQEKLLTKLKEETEKLELRINEYKEIQESIKKEGTQKLFGLLREQDLHFNFHSKNYQYCYGIRCNKRFEATRDNIMKANCYNGQKEDLQYPLKEEPYRNYELFNTVLSILVKQEREIQDLKEKMKEWDVISNSDS
tara:strand:- start:274 stop:687 length:414 start_codon:yes stop_codon:yes gene_type:complete